jgi:hypothetical protein
LGPAIPGRPARWNGLSHVPQRWPPRSSSCGRPAPLSVMTLLVSADKRCSEEQSTLRSRALVDMSGWVTHSMANISCGHDRLAGAFGASPPNTPSDTVRWRPRPFKLWPAHVRSDRDRRPAEPSRTSRPPAQSYPVRSAKQTIRTQIPVAPSAYRGIGSI